MKKVYITSLHLAHGGIEMAVVLLSNALNKRGYHVEILCTYDLGTPAYQIDEGVKVTYLTTVKPNRAEFKDAIRKKNILKIIEESCYSLKVLYYRKYSMVRQVKQIREGTIIATRNQHAVILSKYGASSLNKIAQLHHDHCFDKKLLRDFRKKYTGINKFVVLTDKLKKEIKSILPENSLIELKTIPNFLTQMPDIRLPKVAQVVAVGRLHKVKGFLRLLNLWNKIPEHDVVLKIIGEGEQRKELEAEINKLKLDKKVILTGAMEHSDVMIEMAKSLIYVMTSETEAFPFVLLEAMSVKTPAIAYDVRVGPEAIIQDGKNGFLVSDNDEQGFISKVCCLLENEQKREEFSRNAFARAQEFSEDIIIEKWEQLLN